MTLPEATLAKVQAAREARVMAARLRAAAHGAEVRAARSLQRQALSLRDIGFLLNLSHGRIHQILARGQP